MSFFREHEASIRDLTELYGIDTSQAETLEDFVALTQPWAAGDHARPANRVGVITPELSRRLHGFYDLLGMKSAVPLPEGHYDKIFVLGAIHRGNNRRLGFLAGTLDSGGVTVDEILLMGGERAPYWEVEKVAIQENLEELRGSGRISDPRVEDMVYGGARIRNETELLRLAATVHLGGLAFRASAGYVANYDLRGIPLTVTHTAAVQRPNGAPRHTTQACIRDWLGKVSGSEPMRIGFIATNPHIARMASVANAVICETGMGGRFEIVPAGPGALDTYSHELFRGEVARSLHQELASLNSSKESS